MLCRCHGVDVIATADRFSYHLICPKCGADMAVIAIIHEPVEVKRILDHLLKTGRAPPGVTATSMN